MAGKRKSDADLTAAISSYLIKEGVPAYRKGYAYLICAIRLAYKDSRLTGAVSKAIYPAVAEEFATSPAAVERAVRTAIACACESGGGEKKTNSQFIFRAAEQLRVTGGE